MKTNAILHWQATVAYVLGVFLLASVLLVNAAHAQSMAPAGSGYGHGMPHHRMMRMTMGRTCGTGPASAAMAPQRCRTHGMHRMMGPDSSAPAPAAATEEAAQAGVPAGFLTALNSADSGRGQQLAVANGCVGCHSLAPSQRTAGPTWHGLAETSATRVAGQSAEQYLYTSIAQPNAYVVEGYQPNIMLQNYGQQLSEGDIADIVSYLLTLGGE